MYTKKHTYNRNADHFHVSNPALVIVSMVEPKTGQKMHFIYMYVFNGGAVQVTPGGP